MAGGEHLMPAWTIQLTHHLNSAPDLATRVERLNEVRRLLHDLSPFNSEPVDLVEWVPAEIVHANEYNPNTVAPPEMELLRLSISADGYTQPIVTTDDGEQREVVDGFHRTRVGKECADVAGRVQGFLPVVRIRADRTDKGDRIASTIRHNRARGKHRINAMTDIVVELKQRHWTDERIGRELGMEPDEVLRLCQVAGLAELFADDDFSASWDVADAADDLESFDPDIAADGQQGDRIYHTWDKWEAFHAGFFDSTPKHRNLSADRCKAMYMEFLRDLPRFHTAMDGVLQEWPNSTEHNLTNDRMNRIAWLGQAAMCWDTGIPAAFCNGYSLLRASEQQAADLAALEKLNVYLAGTGRPILPTLEAAGRRTQPELY
jgi:ParB-like chromosome segregation protein Spo0J